MMFNSSKKKKRITSNFYHLRTNQFYFTKCSPEAPAPGGLFLRRWLLQQDKTATCFSLIVYEIHCIIFINLCFLLVYDISQVIIYLSLYD